MIKKLILYLSVLLIAFCAVPVAVQAGSFATVDGGVLKVESPSSSTKLKVKISLGSNGYYYDITRSPESFPVQFGNGSYSVILYQQVSGSQYRVLDQTSVTVNLASDVTAYLGSIQPINWNAAMVAIQKGHELAKAGTTDAKKVEILYNYVSKLIKYDYFKASSVAAGYIPSVEDTYRTQKGICYDYSALYGAMLRSEGIPAKLIKGYKSDMAEYHAWNQVYLNNKWVFIDTTYDSTALANGIKIKMIKADNEYQIAKFY